MRKPLTTKQFIKKAKKVHGERYDYSDSKYINSQTKINIVCKKHGVFEQTPNNHLSGQNCPECGKESYFKSRRKSNKKFIEESKEIHGDKYSYKLTEYIKQGKKVKIICPEHGIFNQLPSNHLRGSGCLKCGTEQRKEKTTYSNDEFIEKCLKVHKDAYDYSLVDYVNIDTKVKILCKDHGLFWQSPYNHLIGNGCPKCAKNYKDNTKSFIKKAVNVHGDKYNYDSVNYVNAHKKVKIECNNHGYFYQSSNNHLKGKGCPDCAYENSVGYWTYNEWEKAGKTSEQFDSFKLYIIKCWGENENFYKIGRTFLKVSQRFASSSIPYEYELISLITHNSGRIICEFENNLHKNNKSNKYIPKKEFKGMHECFKTINEITI